MLQTRSHHEGNASAAERSFSGRGKRRRSTGRLPGRSQSGDVPDHTPSGQYNVLHPYNFFLNRELFENFERETQDFEVNGAVTTLKEKFGITKELIVFPYCIVDCRIKYISPFLLSSAEHLGGGGPPTIFNIFVAHVTAGPSGRAV